MLAELIEKFLMMNKEEALLKDVLINPLFLFRIRDEFADDLMDAGLLISITETDTPEGRIISGQVRKNGSVFNLGAVRLSDKGVEPLGGLRNYFDLIRFIKAVTGD